jgi:hypothetical protein
MNTRWHTTGVLLGILLVGATAAAMLWLRSKTSDSELIRTSLRLGSLPESIKVLECDSPITSDVVTDCYASLEPHAFRELLQGWKFVEHTPNVAKLGQTISDGSTTFPVHRVFAADVSGDPEFKHGGHFLVYVNESRTLVRTSLYIE